MDRDGMYDVAIVGGGAAGLSAAVTLARSLRRVVVIDSGEPRNAPAEGAHNVLAREGTSPLELLAAGRREATGYGAEIREDRAADARRIQDGFSIDLESGAVIASRRILLATGLVDELPEVPGVRELWGSSVLHCPYCHGWEVRGQRIGVLATGPLSIHQVLLFRQLSPDVTLFLHRRPGLSDEEWEQLAALGVSVVTGTVSRLRSEEGALRTVVLEDGHEIPVDALAVGPRFVARSEIYERLGGELTEHPTGRFVATTEPTGRTSIEGVWAAGNVSDLGAALAASMAAGVLAGGGINADLVAEDARAAVAARV